MAPIEQAYFFRALIHWLILHHCFFLKSKMQAAKDGRYLATSSMAWEWENTSTGDGTVASQHPGASENLQMSLK